tara:strand:- start:3444 stop:3992 length:549 start_codon:yes stop_codon:yes gene_type:complete
MEKINGVEATHEDAPVMEEGVEIINENPAPETLSGEVDYEALLQEKEQELEKIARERENYKQGLLRAKGKLSEDEMFAEEAASEDRLRSLVREELLKTESARVSQEREEILKKVIRENKELKLANKTKFQKSGAPVSGGSNMDRPESTTEFWTEDQISAMKARGIDPDKAKENYLKLKARDN